MQFWKEWDSRLAKPSVSLEIAAVLTLNSYSPVKEEMIAGFCYGTWNKLSTPESSPYSLKESIILTFSAWLSTVGTPKYSLEVRRKELSTLGSFTGADNLHKGMLK